MFIGSFSTKREEKIRGDIEIVNPTADPGQFVAMRLLLHCDVSQLGEVIWQSYSEELNEWVDQVGAPPYDAYDLGIMDEIQDPVIIPIIELDDHSFYPASWLHDFRFEMSPDYPELFFQYKPKPRAGQPLQPPIHFRHLRFTQQIQTSTKAECIWKGILAP